MKHIALNTPWIHSMVKGRLLQKRLDFQNAATRSWIIADTETRTAPMALYEAHGLDRVTGVGISTTLEDELVRIQGGLKEHGATVGYQLNGVHLIDGVLYGQGFKHRLTNQPHRLFRSRTVRRFATASLASTYYGSIYFGHWIKDDLMLQLLADEYGETFQIARPAYGHEAGYSQLLGLASNSLAEAYFDELILFEDRGKNRHRNERFRVLRERLKHQGGNRNHRVYIRRGQSQALMERAIRNPIPLETFLEARGFTIIDPDRMTSAQIVEATQGAKIILGVEGSHLAHGIYTIADGGTFCILQPPYRFNNIFKDFTDAIGLNYAFTVGHEVEGGFNVDLDELLRLIDRIESLS